MCFPLVHNVALDHEDKLVELVEDLGRGLMDGRNNGATVLGNLV